MTTHLPLHDRDARQSPYPIDLEDASEIAAVHIGEALRYRPMARPAGIVIPALVSQEA